jgi:hypothetical protein
MTKSKILLLILTITLLVACSTGAPATSTVDAEATAAAAEQTEAAAPTATPEPTEVPPTRTPIPTRDPYGTHEFDDEDALVNWDYLYFGDPGSSHYYVEDGSLAIEVTEEDSYAYLFYTGVGSYDDVRLEAQVRNSGANRNWISLVCRQTARGWYEFNVGSDGFYTIYSYHGLSGFTELTSGSAKSINTGKDINVLTVSCVGNELSLAVNGIEINTVTNDDWTRGNVGVSVSAYDILPVVAFFDKVTISPP